MKLYTFEKHQFKVDEDGFIPLSEFAEPLFDNDVVSLATIITEAPGTILFEEANIIHNISSKNSRDPTRSYVSGYYPWHSLERRNSQGFFCKICRNNANASKAIP